MAKADQLFFCLENMGEKVCRKSLFFIPTFIAGEGRPEKYKGFQLNISCSLFASHLLRIVTKNIS